MLYYQRLRLKESIVISERYVAALYLLRQGSKVCLMPSHRLNSPPKLLMRYIFLLVVHSLRMTWVNLSRARKCQSIGLCLAPKWIWTRSMPMHPRPPKTFHLMQVPPRKLPEPALLWYYFSCVKWSSYSTNVRFCRTTTYLGHQS